MWAPLALVGPAFTLAALAKLLFPKWNGIAIPKTLQTSAEGLGSLLYQDLGLNCHKLQMTKSLCLFSLPRSLATSVGPWSWKEQPDNQNRTRPLVIHHRHQLTANTSAVDGKRYQKSDVFKASPWLHRDFTHFLQPDPHRSPERLGWTGSLTIARPDKSLGLNKRLNKLWIVKNDETHAELSSSLFNWELPFLDVSKNGKWTANIQSCH